jgi:hypothetical protein
VNEVLELLKKAQTAKLWGQIEITFRNGEITLVRRTESIRLDGMGGTHQNEHRNNFPR